MKKSFPSERELGSYLASDKKINILIFDSIDSTNSEAKRYCRAGGALPALFISREQTGGRGRLGRSFDSMRDAGLYMTLAFTPKRGASPHSLTLTAGCAVLLAIKDLCNTHPKIKWVNDILINEKKVAGILAEGAFDADGNMPYALVGIGVNLKKRPFPEELTAKVGTLEEFSEKAPDINELAAKITSLFLSLSERFDVALGIYKKELDTLGKRVLVTGKEDGEFLADVKDIDEEGNLIVQRDDGSEVKLFFGEISVITQQ